MDEIEFKIFLIRISNLIIFNFNAFNMFLKINHSNKNLFTSM